MLCYRIAPVKHNKPENVLSGIGGHYSEGRWHYMGVSIVYTASSRSLAMLERLVNDSSDILSTALSITTMLIPDNIKIVRLSVAELPSGWDAHPYTGHTQKIGAEWNKKADSAVLQVPSSLSHDEYNFIFNPEHPDAKSITCIDCKASTYPNRLAQKL